MKSGIFSLLMNLFEKGELERFARHTFGSKILRVVSPNASRQRQVSELVDALEERDLIDDRFFDALRESRPDGEKEIEMARAEYFESANRTRDLKSMGAENPVSSALESVRDDTPEIALEGTGASAQDDQANERSAFRRRMLARLESAVKEAPMELPQSWLDAAAVLPFFEPNKLRPISGDADSGTNGLVRLASVCDTLLDGKWSLHLRPREESIQRLWTEGLLMEALDANPHEKSEHSRILRRLAEDGKPIPVNEIGGHDALVAASEISDWFQKCDFSPFDLDLLVSMLERQESIAPLQRLTGTHFRGREEEQAKLHAFLDPHGAEKILVVAGSGGVGKSSLLGKLLLDLESDSETTYPWAYLDFDDPAVRPSSLVEIVGHISRQLSLLYADREASSQAFLGVESAAAGDRALAFTIPLMEETDPEISELLAALNEAICQIAEGEPRLLIVFDTFEQVQVRGNSAVAAVRSLIDDLLESLPYARVIVSGRALVGEWDDVVPLALENLDDDSADEVLTALGVGEQSLRKELIRNLDTSPLSLRLAAHAIESGQLDEGDVEAMVQGAKQVELQGQLYTRILGHITDMEVRRLAHPGLIVRRVTPGVIREVLASECGIDPASADALFERLPDHVTLFEPDEAAPGEDRALRHRQDVRETMLRLMHQDPGWEDRMAAIHDAAVRYYSPKKAPVHRAEEIYHRLIRDDDPKVLDSAWPDDLEGSELENLVNSLGRCWKEELPHRARMWLGPRIGRSHGDQSDWRTEDWEVSARREAQVLLQKKQPEKALGVLRTRTGRTPGSPLYALEVRSLMDLGKLSEAHIVLEASLLGTETSGSPAEILSLRLLGAELSLASSDATTFRTHIDEAVELAIKLSDEKGQLKAFELRVSGDRQFGGSKDAASNAEALEFAFAETNAATLRKDSDVSRRIVQLMGAQSKDILKKAAVAFGNRADQGVLRTNAFQLEELLSRVESTSEGRVELSNWLLK